MVEQIGREKLLSAPVYKVEEFENGSIMLQLHEHPFCKIPESQRKPALKHLGISQPKKAKAPKWLKKKPPTDIKLKEETTVRLVAGINAAELSIPGHPQQNLFDFYCEEIHQRVRNFEFVPYAVGFKHWFNSLATGLEAFTAGSNEAGDDEFEAFIGLSVGPERQIFQKGGKGFIQAHELDMNKIGPTLELVGAKLWGLGIHGEPKFHSLLFLFQEDVP